MKLCILCLSVFVIRVSSSKETCGKVFNVDNLSERNAIDITSIPWLGILLYPIARSKQLTTQVVLVTRQFVIATASDIDKLPKKEFRQRARVILGLPCNVVESAFRILEYTFHPEYPRVTRSSICLIQLKAYFLNAPLFQTKRFGCDKDNSVIYNEVNLSNKTVCERFYRTQKPRAPWPLRAICVVSKTSQPPCLLPAGAALLVKEKPDRWRFLGFGIAGSGCSRPARFIQYAPYAGWVVRVLKNIGRTAVTRVSSSHYILRTGLARIQRFGLCDTEEGANLIYYDSVELRSVHNLQVIDSNTNATYAYNITLLDRVEYTCITFKVVGPDASTAKQPSILSVRRFFKDHVGFCNAFNTMRVDFEVTVSARGANGFQVAAYGTPALITRPQIVMNYFNRKFYKHPTWPAWSKKDEHSRNFGNER